MEAGAGLGFTQSPLPPTPSKRATSLDFHGEECGILADKSNAGEASTVEMRAHHQKNTYSGRAPTMTAEILAVIAFVITFIITARITKTKREARETKGDRDE